jgi:hypothetical protein
MTDRELMQMALDALEEYIVNPNAWQTQKNDVAKALRDRLAQHEQGPVPYVDPKCKTHPDAPHGFDRNASLSEDRYVCECESWEPPPESEPMRTPKFGDRIVCLKDEIFGTVISLTDTGLPKVKFDDGCCVTYSLQEFTELFCYTSSPKREWVGLTDEEFLELAQTAERGNYLTALRRMQAKLKEKNA